jgi:hypothetical protein
MRSLPGGGACRALRKTILTFCQRLGKPARGAARYCCGHLAAREFGACKTQTQFDPRQRQPDPETERAHLRAAIAVLQGIAIAPRRAGTLPVAAVQSGHSNIIVRRKNWTPPPSTLLGGGRFRLGIDVKKLFHFSIINHFFARGFCFCSPMTPWPWWGISPNPAGRRIALTQGFGMGDNT